MTATFNILQSHFELCQQNVEICGHISNLQLPIVILKKNQLYQTCVIVYQNCISDVESSNKCRMYREIKTVYKCENYMDCNVRHDLRMYYTKFRLSSHKFLVERARWRKEQIPYHERTCSLCNIHDVQDEYHIALICKYFKNVREKYVKQYYYNSPSMMKFIELMNTHNSKERFRFMLFLKIVFKLYAETL